MKGYLYLANSTKSGASKKEMTLTNMSLAGIKAANELGYKSWIGVDLGIEKLNSPHDVSFFNVGVYRNPLAFRDNRKAYKTLVKEIRENSIDFIHCNTPVGGILGRLAGKKCKVKKVIYQVHGFHFYKGAPKRNWMLYYPVEKWLAHHTDALITINREDFEFAKKKIKLRGGGKVYYVPGVGIDTADYAPNEQIRASKREELGFSDELFYIVSAGRLEHNKNNATLIKAVAHSNNKRLRLVLCGDGVQREELKTLAKELDIEEQVIFLGNRSDMREIYLAVDAFAMASYREGLSRTIMEAMSSGLPCAVSKIRGNVDLVEDGKGGYLYSPADYAGFAEAFNKLSCDSELRRAMSEYNLEYIKSFDSDVVRKELKKIYEDVLN